MTAFDLKPRTVGELLDAAFTVYRRQFTRLLCVTAIVSFPAMVLAAIYAPDAAVAARSYWDTLVHGGVRHQGDVVGAYNEAMDAVWKMWPFLLLSGLLQTLERSGAVVTMAFVAAAALRREHSPTVGTLFRRALPRLPAAILAQFALDQVVGCAWCCLPLAVVLLVMFASTGAAIALERGPLETSLRASVPAWIRWMVLPFACAIDGTIRSVSLSTSGPVLARGSLYLFFLYSFVTVANGSAVAIGAMFGNQNGAWYWAQHCSEALIAPVWGLSVALWFADLRVRREGIDLAVVGA